MIRPFVDCKKDIPFLSPLICLNFYIKCATLSDNLTGKSVRELKSLVWVYI